MITLRHILVTGAAGFIGSHLCDYLLEKNYSVLAIDDLSLGKKENLPIHKNLTFLQCDLRKKSQIENIVNKYKPEIIFHLAAWAHEGLSQFMPAKITETNYNTFLNLIAPSIKNRLKKIIVCSSMSVYGNQKPPFTENMLRKPVDIYGVAKAAMEQATEILSSVYGFDYVIVRPHNVYGPNQNMSDPYRNVVAIFINRLLSKKPFYIYGDGNQKRAFTYIDDLVPYLAKTGLRKKFSKTIYNIGPRKEYSINQLAHIILREFKSNLKPIYLPKRPAEVDHAFCSSKKAEKELGYKTSVDLKTGTRKMIEWAKKNGYEKPKYLKKLEITTNILPETWDKELI